MGSKRRLAALLFVTGAIAANALAASCGGGGGGGGGSTPKGTNVVTVVDINTGAAQAGVDVVVQDSAGNPLTHLLTASDGTANVTVPQNGYVSVYSPEHFPLNQFNAFVGQGVQAPPAGQPLTFKIFPAFPAPTPPLTTYAVTITGPTVGTTIELLGPCFNSTVIVTTNFALVQSPCSAPGKLLGIVKVGNDITAYGVAAVAADPGGQVIPVSLAITQVDLDVLHFNAKNLSFPAPAVPSTAGFSIGLIDLHFNMEVEVNGSGATVSGSIGYPAGVSTSAQFRLDGRLCPDAGGYCTYSVSHNIQLPFPPPATSQAFDNATFLAVADPLDRSNPGRPVSRWVEAVSAGTPIEPACATGMFQWQSFSGDLGEYTLLSPPAGGSMQAPGVPPELADFGPTLDDQITLATIALQTSPQFTGYGDCVGHVPVADTIFANTVVYSP